MAEWSTYRRSYTKHYTIKLRWNGAKGKKCVSHTWTRQFGAFIVRRCPKLWQNKCAYGRFVNLCHLLVLTEYRSHRLASALMGLLHLCTECCSWAKSARLLLLMMMPLLLLLPLLPLLLHVVFVQLVCFRRHYSCFSSSCHSLGHCCSHGRCWWPVRW